MSEWFDSASRYFNILVVLAVLVLVTVIVVFNVIVVVLVVLAVVGNSTTSINKWTIRCSFYPNSPHIYSAFIILS